MGLRMKTNVFIPIGIIATLVGGVLGIPWLSLPGLICMGIGVFKHLGTKQQEKREWGKRR